MKMFSETNIPKYSPLVVLYLLLMVVFMGASYYEAMITMTAIIPLVAYLFNKNPKIGAILKLILYVFAIGLSVYIINLLLIDCNWFSFNLEQTYNETIWNTLRYNGFFSYNLKYLIYLGIIFLTIKSRHLSDEKFTLLKNDIGKIIINKFNVIKKSRLARLFALSYAYLIICTFLTGILWPFLDKGTSFDSDYMWTILFVIPFLFTALYIILRKKQWIILPAKIVFWIILVLAGLLLIDIEDMVMTEPILVVLFFLMIWPLLDLYGSNLQNWALSLKNKPFSIFKKKSEISIKEIILMVLTVIVLCVSYAYDAEFYDFISYSVLTGALLIILYLLLKESPLKSIIKLIIILGYALLLFEVLVSIINGNLTHYIFFEGINNVFIRESLRYASVLAPSLYGLGIIFLNKNINL